MNTVHVLVRPWKYHSPSAYIPKHIAVHCCPLPFCHRPQLTASRQKWLQKNSTAAATTCFIASAAPAELQILLYCQADGMKMLTTAPACACSSPLKPLNTQTKQAISSNGKAVITINTIRDQRCQDASFLGLLMQYPMSNPVQPAPHVQCVESGLFQHTISN